MLQTKFRLVVDTSFGKAVQMSQIVYVRKRQRISFRLMAATKSGVRKSARVRAFLSATANRDLDGRSDT